MAMGFMKNNVKYKILLFLFQEKFNERYMLVNIKFFG